MDWQDISKFNMDWQDISKFIPSIDGASVTIILCLHVLVVRRILLILDMLIIFSEYICLKL
jgi:hypothetical protein